MICIHQKMFLLAFLTHLNVKKIHVKVGSLVLSFLRWQAPQERFAYLPTCLKNNNLYR